VDGWLKVGPLGMENILKCDRVVKWITKICEMMH